MNVALIPVRGGSKSIPLKNVKQICGRPLVYWTIKAACQSNNIDKVYVSTDSERIKDIVETFQQEELQLGKEEFSKVKVIGRSEETATDTASTESVMLEFAEHYKFDNIVLIQATSPLLRAEDLDNGFDAFFMPDTDSVLSVVRQKRFFWQEEDGFVIPQNYDVFHRPMRQQFQGCLVENGAFYITSKKSLLKSKNRISGNIRAVELPEETYYEIDEPSDWKIVEAMMKENINKRMFMKQDFSWKEMSQTENWKQKLEKTGNNIKLFLTDCDGCLTDGGMYYTQNGDEIKKFSTYDGMGFQLLKEHGICTGIITGEDNILVENRAKKLKVDILKMGVKDKLSVIKMICKKQGIDLENVVYVGDDINDLEVIKAVGFGCCVQNAQEEVKDVSQYVAKKHGGEGAVREIIDMILK